MDEAKDLDSKKLSQIEEFLSAIEDKGPEFLKHHLNEIGSQFRKSYKGLFESLLQEGKLLVENIE